ncbi:MAG: 5'/3'-nucleotidase SurE [Desulfobacteraceae bacterium]|jgi:5'-nucleotidase
MHILLTNDDGIHAPGIWALYSRFVEKHVVTVIAPDREQSAVGHGITLHQPLRVAKVSINGTCPGYTVNGTPADCVKFAVLELLESKPDLLISGINPGANVGVNINYSGTVAAAKEAALYGISAMAVSIQGHDSPHYEEVAHFMEKLAHKVVDNGLPPGTYLNVNIPAIPMRKICGIRISNLSVNFFPEHMEKRVDPRNRAYYWQGCDALPVSDNPNIDGTALSERYISITPLKCDVTDYASIEELKKWEIDMPGDESK